MRDSVGISAMLRRAKNRHMSGSFDALSYGKNYAKHKNAQFSYTNILIINYLWAAFEHMATRTQTFATAIANVCNRDCKYLQSGVYTII